MTTAPTSLFTDDALAAKAKQFLDLADEDLVPAGHRGALVAIADQDHLQVGVAAKVGDSWEVGMFVDHPWAGDHTSGEITLLRSW